MQFEHKENMTRLSGGSCVGEPPGRRRARWPMSLEMGPSPGAWAVSISPWRTESALTVTSEPTAAAAAGSALRCSRNLVRARASESHELVDLRLSLRARQP